MFLSSNGYFRRGGAHDNRRRRVLTDVLFGTDTAGQVLRVTRQRGGSRALASRYASDYMDEQLQLTDLIPRRLASFLVLYVIGFGIIAGLDFAYAWLPVLSRYTTSGKLAALDLSGESNLAAWFSSTWLGLAGLVSIVVYSVRRHRCDDYSGRYRIWLWGALCCFMLSLDRTANLHEGFKELMAHLTGTRLYGDGSLWWAIPYVFLVGAIGLRLLLDMRESWLSSLSLVAAAVAFGCSQAARLGWLERLPREFLPLAKGPTRQVLIEQGAQLAAAFLLLMAVGLHARFVILDAAGLIRRRRVRLRTVALPRRSSGRKSDLVPTVVALKEPGGTPVLVETTDLDAAHSLSGPIVTSGSTIVATPDGGIAVSDGSGSRKLNKAEKRALRKRLEQMRDQRDRGW